MTARVRRRHVTIGAPSHRHLHRGARIDIVATKRGFRGDGWRLRAVGRQNVDLAAQHLCVVKAPNRLRRCPKQK
jgi:hypothetical protein